MLYVTILDREYQSLICSYKVRAFLSSLPHHTGNYISKLHYNLPSTKGTYITHTLTASLSPFGTLESTSLLDNIITSKLFRALLVVDECLPSIIIPILVQSRICCHRPLNELLTFRSRKRSTRMWLWKKFLGPWFQPQQPQYKRCKFPIQPPRMAKNLQ